MKKAYEYFHKVNKDLIPVCKILGVNIAAIDMDWLMDFTHRHIKELSGDYMCVSNVHTTVTSFMDKEYCAVQNGGIMAIPDGGPLSTEGRRRGFADIRRTTGPDYLVNILKCSAENGYSHYFFGSTDETLQKLSAAIQRDYPGVKIAGMYSPPFRQLTEKETAKMLEMINAANADFVWVGLGAPKQEFWMAEHQGKIHGFMVGVGAAFDYLAGNIKRAPVWMQKANLEWLFRLMQDPVRLFSRYFYTNAVFLWNAVVKGL